MAGGLIEPILVRAIARNARREIIVFESKNKSEGIERAKL